MGLIKLMIIGILLGLGLYYLRMYMKGPKCHLEDRIDGKNVLITGANTGMGLELAVELAKRGGIIHMACRDESKCSKGKNRVLKEAKVDDGKVFTHSLNLADFRSILKFAREFQSAVPQLEILVNNAGLLRFSYSETNDGFEEQLGVNHLGHFLLTNQLLSVLKNSPSDARIVTISSGLHVLTSMNVSGVLEEGSGQTGFSGVVSHARSKLANVLHTRALAHKLKHHNIAAVSVNPGAANTALWRHSYQLLQSLAPFLEHVVLRSPLEGVQTQLCCAVDPDLMQSTSQLFQDNKVHRSASSDVYNDTVVEWLWNQSVLLINNKLEDL